MDSGAVVVDISSDDESDGLRTDKQLEFNVSCFLVDKEENVDDVLVSDNWFDCSSGNSDFLRPQKGTVVSRDDSDDDDCLILDGDPDKPVTICNDGKGNGGGTVDASDDLLIVGQKGQVACRDFPHSRHLCANFPFDSTSHVKHCSLCHCFVCDSSAPCVFWGNGLSLTDHCNATDKNDTWKAQRRAFQKITILHPQRLHIPTGNPIQRPPSVPNTQQPPRHPIPQLTQASSRNHIRPCSTRGSIPPQIISQTSTGFINRLNPSCMQPRPAILYSQREERVNFALSRPNLQSQPQFKRVAVVPPKGTSSTAPCQKQMPGTNWRVAQPRPVQLSASQQQPAPVRPQQMPQFRLVTQQRPQQMPQLPLVTQQRPQVTAQMPQSTAAVSCEDNEVRRWQDILKGVASELGVADCMSENVTAAQPYTAASHHPPSYHMTSIQGTGPTINASDYPGFDSRWLNPIPQQLPEERMCNDLGPAKKSVGTGDANLDSFLAAIESENNNTVSVPGKETGLLGEDLVASLFDFDGSWSSIANV